MFKKIAAFLLNPFVFSAIISAGILLISPLRFPKYQTELISSEFFASRDVVYFEDLNNDGFSEKIRSMENIIDQAAIMVYGANGGLIDQWNLKSKFLGNSIKTSFNNIDNDDFKEVYIVSQRADSVFLNILEPLDPNGIHLTDIFIDTIVPYNNEFHAYTGQILVEDLRNNNTKEIIFSVNAGNAGNLRNIYTYNIDTGELKKSPHLSNYSSLVRVADIDNDGYKEIIVSNHSSGNGLVSNYNHRSDYSTWFYLLDHKLNFLFEPKEYKVAFSGIRTIPYQTKTDTTLIAYIESRQPEKLKSTLIHSSLKGEILEEVVFEGKRKYLHLNNFTNKLFIYHSYEGKVELLNSKFEVENSIRTLKNTDIYPYDIDMDGVDEWFLKQWDMSFVTIYRNDFSHPVSLELMGNSGSLFNFGVKGNGEKPSEIYIQSGNNTYVFSYNKNPLFFLNYFIIPLIYSFVLLLVWLINKGQKIRMEKKLAIEKEIAQLQIKNLKNQVDPHFVFNAINSMSEMVLTDNKMEADKFIGKFSHLMRGTLKNSDKISCTLEEEINYVENYIQLQQIRFMQGFDYEISTQEGLNMATIVPKHVLYSYVENAIKHGIPHDKKGFLKIDIKQDEKLRLTIEDNGGGLENAKITDRNSTGSGIQIMEQMYQLYSKLYNRKISHIVQNTFDVSNKPAGVRVEVTISI